MDNSEQANPDYTTVADIVRDIEEQLELEEAPFAYCLFCGNEIYMDEYAEESPFGFYDLDCSKLLASLAGREEPTYVLCEDLEPF